MYRHKEQLKKDILKKRIVLEKELQNEIQKELANELAMQKKDKLDEPSRDDDANAINSIKKR